MKKYICILAGAALLAACEQKTETTAPAASPTASPEATLATSPTEPTTMSPVESSPSPTP
jgi:PBP1b-binding outer membrane lipoprotein LpoB